jgi:hypothetical protein
MHTLLSVHAWLVCTGQPHRTAATHGSAPVLAASCSLLGGLHAAQGAQHKDVRIDHRHPAAPPPPWPQVLQDKFNISSSEATWGVRYIVQRVCRAVAQRSAQMAAAAISGVLRHRGVLEQPRRVVVAVDGGVYDNYANYRWAGVVGGGGGQWG